MDNRTIRMPSIVRALMAFFMLSAGLIIAGPTHATPDDAVKLQLKATVMDHIADQTDGDAYYFVDPDETTVKVLSFVAMHPVMFERDDGTYVLCADFRDSEGDLVLIDYFVRRQNDGYFVIGSVAGRRSIMMRLGERFGL